MRIFQVATTLILLTLATHVSAQQTATGIVFYDTNLNKIFDPGETPLPDVRVSNGREIVRTGADGRYQLPVDDDTILFVIKPKGWRNPFNKDMLPQFYYIHKPNGSPKSHFPGVPPTGPLPASVDFPMYPQDEPEVFKALFFGDPQPRNQKEVEYVYHDVIEQLIGTTASFGVTLGDIAFDNLDTLDTQNQGIAMLGIPWYSVIGNHDLNNEATTDKDSDETFHRIYGPNYYSFDYGNVHFIALDDVEWSREPDQKSGKYQGGLDEAQMEFIRNDLALIPEDQMVVLMMHIPLVQIGNRAELFRLIEKRPLCVSISGHTHYQEHLFLEGKDGWHGPQPHHHIINVTVSGSWWSGVPDEYGIPHTMMRDGAPNGYSVMTFDGKKYDWEFFAARRPAEYQLHIHAPETLPVDRTSTEILVNVFGGSDRSKVEIQVGKDAPWIPLAKVMRRDPVFLDLKEKEHENRGKPGLGRQLPDPIASPHLWQGATPPGLSPGTHLISIRTTDMFGKTYTGDRIIRVK